MEIINFEKRKMKLLISKQLKSYENTKICYICKEKFQDKHAKDTKYCKLWTIVITQGNIEAQHIAYVI